MGPKSTIFPPLDKTNLLNLLIALILDLSDNQLYSLGKSIFSLLLTCLFEITTTSPFLIFSKIQFLIIDCELFVQLSPRKIQLEIATERQPTTNEKVAWSENNPFGEF